MSNAEGINPPRPRVRWLRWLFIAGGAVLALAIAVFIVWALTPYRADETALEAMRSGGGVMVTEAREGIVFMPDTNPTTALVLYPGGRVEAEAYAPLARLIAEEGYLVVIEPMPLYLAVFGIGRAQRALDAFPEIDSWAVGGHSLGGTMAAEFAAREPDSISGLVFLASYPASSTDLSDAALSVLSLRGTNDGLVTEQDVEDAQLLLPPRSELITIDGGNHAGFGSYGKQAGDGGSTLPEGAQASITADAVAKLLATLTE
jgi:hypothetical protein